MNPITAVRAVPDAMPASAESDPAAWLRAVDPGIDLPERELQLYARYVRVLALLCECAPYVDDDHYVDVIDAVIADACGHYPLVARKDGDRCEIAIGRTRPA